MASFVKPSSDRTTPFGRNEFLRSTNPKPRTESHTLSAAAWPAQTVDGTSQKIAQPGTVLAAITSGDEVGKVGPYQAGATDGRGSEANLVGLLLTFLPWQLLERDVEVSVCYDSTVAVQAWCLEHDGDEFVPLSNATADALRGSKKLDILFS